VIAYIRIPKTASCSVLGALEGSGVVSHVHEPASFYTEATATFTFVRNPWQRLFSWYRHAKYFQRRSFREYVLGEELDPMQPVAPTQVYRHGNANATDLLIADQREWWRDLRPTYIGKFETLDRDLHCIGSLLGFEVKPIQHLNASEDRVEHPYDSGIWDAEMIERMAPIFDPFAAEFGYEVHPF
jgi:hypothetical protein